MKDLTKALQTAADGLDNVHTSAEEREAELSGRHAVDMASDNWLSKSVRPITVLYLLFLLTVIVVLESTGAVIPTDTKVLVGTLNVTGMGFYFRSKQQERIAEKNVKANAQLEVMKEKARIREERKQNRHERLQERRDG